MNEKMQRERELLLERIEEILSPPQHTPTEGKELVPITDYMGESISHQTSLGSNEEIFEFVKSLILENKDYYLISDSIMSLNLKTLNIDSGESLSIRDKSISSFLVMGSDCGNHFDDYCITPELVDCSADGVGTPIIPRVIFAIEHGGLYRHYSPQSNVVNAIMQRAKAIRSKFPGHKFAVIKLC